MSSSGIARICALCQAPSLLRRSHLLPKALYRYIRMSGGKPFDPIHVSHGVSLSTSVQAAGHLLCHDCEQRFSSLGERPTLRVCYRGPTSFDLAARLEKQKPLYKSHDGEFYDATFLGNLREQLAYFAISVLWRWSVGHDIWPQSTKWPRRLGRYEQVLRPYLLGLATRPGSVHVWTEALKPTISLDFFSFPAGSESGSPRTYEFWIPGIRFVILVGSGIDPAIRRTSLTGEQTPTIACSDPKRIRYFGELVRFVKAAQPKGKLAAGA